MATLHPISACCSLLPLWLIGFALSCQCEDSTTEAPTGTASTGVTRRDLTPELEQKVLAKVGDRTITLGDYVSALERMDSFERLRYQTPERRKLLLDEMIDVELLAREAERRGLPDEPETKAYLRQVMREALLRELRDQQPRVEDIDPIEVRAYYEAHREDFHDPERRRVAVIALPTRAVAEKVLAELSDAGEEAAQRWGELARQQSLLASSPKGGPETARPPLELEGDLGLVSAPGEARGSNPKVPEKVRAALFEIDEQGEVHDEVVAAEGRFYVVRLVALNPARQRSLEEADTIIRVQLLQAKIEKAEAALEAELRQQFPVSVDGAVLKRLELPDPGPAGQAPRATSTLAPE